MIHVPLSFLMLAGAARAQTWTAADLAGAFDDDNPGAVANMAFNDQIQNRGFHQLCDNLPTDAHFSDNQGLTKSLQEGDGGVLAGGAVGASRGFHRYPTGALALVDEVDADVSVGEAKRLMRSAIGGAPVMLVFNTESQGRSTVVRPLEGTTDSCQELRQILNLKTFKTAFPLSAKRIGGMQVGELWRFPASFKIGIGPQAGAYPAGPAFSAGVFISLTHSRSREGMATLYRLAPDVLRFRVHIDRAQAFTLSGEAIGSPLPLLTLWENDSRRAMSRFLGPVASAISAAIFDALNNYLTAVFNASVARGGSDEVVLEYLLNPSDAEQMQGLEQALKGDLAAISPIALAKDLKPGSREKSVREFLDGLTEANDAKIGISPNYAGADRKDKVRSRHIHVRIPMVMDFDHTRSSGRDQIVSKDLRAGELNVRSAGSTSSRGGLDIPGIKGALKRTQGQRDVKVVSSSDVSGAAAPPFVVYVQQEGFLRGKRDKVAEVEARTGGVMASLRGGAPPPVALPTPGADKAKFTGAATLTVVLDAKAIQDILGASARSVVSAFADSLDGKRRDLMKQLIADGLVHDDGRIDDVGAYFADASVSQLAAELASQATGLVADLTAARSAGSVDARSQALARLLSGQGVSSLAYEAAMKVVLRLADPADVAADYLTILKGPGAQSQRYRYNVPAFQDQDLKRFSQANRRFMQPLPLSD